MFFKTVVTAFVLTAITLMIYPVNAAESEGYVTRNLIGYWTMNRAGIDGDTVKDISGNNNHGEIRGNPQIVPGKIGEALDFDGVDDYVALPDLGHNREVTVEVWAKIDQPIGVREVYGLVSTFGVPHQMPGSVVTFSVRFNVEFNQIHFSRHDKTLDTSSRGGPVNPYTWYHFAYTCDVRSRGMNSRRTLMEKGGQLILSWHSHPTGNSQTLKRHQSISPVSESEVSSRADTFQVSLMKFASIIAL